MLGEAAGYTASLLFAQDRDSLRTLYLTKMIVLIITPHIAQAFLHVALALLIAAAPVPRFLCILRSSWRPIMILVGAAWSSLVCVIIQTVGCVLEVNLNDSSTASEHKLAGNIVLAGFIAQLAYLALFLIVFVRFNMKLNKVLCGTREWAVVKWTTCMSSAVSMMAVRNVYRATRFARVQHARYPESGDNETDFLVLEAAPMLVLGALFAWAHFEGAHVFARLAGQRADNGGAVVEAVSPNGEVPHNGEVSAGAGHAVKA